MYKNYCQRLCKVLVDPNLQHKWELQTNWVRQNTFRNFYRVLAIQISKKNNELTLVIFSYIQIFQKRHCVKSVQIRSYFWSVFSCIRIEYRKMRTRNNFVFVFTQREDQDSGVPWITLYRKLDIYWKFGHLPSRDSIVKY